MSLLNRLPGIAEAAQNEYNDCPCKDFDVRSAYGDGRDILSYGDNLSFMKYLLEKKDMRGAVQMIYVDPPFFSGSSHQAGFKLQSKVIGDIPVIRPDAYDDRWESSVDDYLIMLTSRLIAMKDLLCDTGCIWVHLDWRMIHYVKIIMDELFGEKNFINEVIWQYKSGGAGKKHFARKHDTLLLYGKTNRYYLDVGKEKSYNRGLKPYRFKGVKEYEDEHGWYTLVNVKDVWQMNMVGRTADERTGYATQKPEALIKRIIESTSREGDICADFFCGAGTLPAVAHSCNRKWIACDSGKIAAAVSKRRLSSLDESSFVYVTENGTCDDESGSIQIATRCMGETKSGKRIIKIALEKYCPEMDKLPLHGKDKDTVVDIVAKDSIALIDMWSVDTDYDNEVHRPSRCLSRKKGYIETEIICEAEKGSTINIETNDIFGICVCRTFDTDEIEE